MTIATTTQYTPLPKLHLSIRPPEAFGTGLCPELADAVALTSATPLPSSLVTTKISPVESELIYNLPFASHASPTGRKHERGQADRSGLDTTSMAAVVLFDGATGEPAPLKGTRVSL